MSKPVTNVEIEDVLSSIRRLVSNTNRVESGEEKTPEGPGDKLVLTPSLRVDDGNSNIGNTVTEQDLELDISSESSEVDHREEDAEMASEEDAVAELELETEEEFLELIPTPVDAVEEGDEREEQPDDSAADSHADMPDPSELVADTVQEITDNSPEISESDDEISTRADAGEDTGVLDGDVTEAPAMPEDVDAAPQPTSDGENLQSRAAEFEAIVAEKQDQWDPDGTTQDDNAAILGGPVPWEDRDEAVEDDGVHDPLDALVDGTAPAGDAAPEISNDGPDLTSAEDNDVAGTAPDTLSDAPPDQPQDAATETDDEEFAAETVPFVFRSQSASRGEAMPDGEVSADLNPYVAPAASAEALLDEEALRDLVSEIVRQELQGALGERITRNVRKLVRREIHRALASQELE